MRDPRGDNPVRLMTKSFGGNVHQTATIINKLGLASYVLAMECNGSNMTNVVFRTNKKEEWYWLRDMFGHLGEF